MKFLTNIKIDQRALDYMLSTKGNRRPLSPPEPYQVDTYKTWIDSGYDINNLYWESFNGSNFPFEVDIPYEGSWWFSKLLPGSVFPYHQDIYASTVPKRRLWIAYSDYQPGHIFSYGNKVLTDYKAGDVFEFEDTMVWHGAANCGLIPKISLQIVVT